MNYIEKLYRSMAMKTGQDVVNARRLELRLEALSVQAMVQQGLGYAVGMGQDDSSYRSQYFAFTSYAGEQYIPVSVVYPAGGNGFIYSVIYPDSHALFFEDKASVVASLVRYIRNSSKVWSLTHPSRMPDAGQQPKLELVKETEQ